MIVAIALSVALVAPAGLVEDLYSHRLLFDGKGHPVVPVGMMRGATRVVLESETGLVFTLLDGEKEERVVLPARTTLTVEKGPGKPAVFDELWVIETLEGDERAHKREVAATWRSRGISAEVLDVGGVYGVKGTVVDNRASLIVTRATSRRTELERLEALGARPTPIERLRELPSVEIRVGARRASAVRVSPAGDAPILVHDVEHNIGYAEHGFADRLLRGDVAIVADKSGALAVVNLVDEDGLVAGVLPSEMYATAPLEALKAQAVTARGELFAKIGRRHLADPALVCSEQHCQVYKGMTAEHPRATQAAEETRGELAFVGERLVDSVYSACCGGHTEAADVVWDRPAQSALVGRADAPFADPASRPWLKPGVEGSAFAAHVRHNAGGVPVDLRSDEAVRAFLALPREAAFCGRSSFNQKGSAWRWERKFTRAELEEAFADLGVGEVRGLRVEERGSGGRLRALVVEGKKKTARVLRELPVRKRLGNLRSGLFVIDEERAPDGRLLGVTLRGAGFGHGSGMCQQGAIGMAEAGLDYRAILRHYYAGAEVRKVF